MESTRTVDVEGRPENEGNAAVLSTAQQIPNGGLFLVSAIVFLLFQSVSFIRLHCLLNDEHLKLTFKVVL